MNINYNIDHKLLNQPIFMEKRSALNHIVLLCLLSQIVHFTKHTGHCQVWIKQIAKDYGCNSRVVSAQLKALVDAGLIREIKPWNHQTKEAGWYLAGSRLVPGRSKTGAPTTQVNNIKLFKREDVVDTPPPFKKEFTFPAQSTKEPNWNQNNKKKNE
jgi:hypothetical protein